MVRTCLIGAILAAICTGAVEAGSSNKHQPAAGRDEPRKDLVLPSDPPPPSGFALPSTAGTSAVGSPLVGGGRLSGRIE